MLGTERDSDALILLIRREGSTGAAGTLEKDHFASGIGLIGEGRVGPVMAMIIPKVEVPALAAHGDDKAVDGNSEHGDQSGESGHGDLHCDGWEILNTLDGLLDLCLR